MKYLRKSKSLNVQVSLLICCVVLLSGLIIMAINYAITFTHTISNLKETSLNLAEYINKNLNSSLLIGIKNKSDMDLPIYKTGCTFLNQIREITSLKYLYTAGYDDKGELIYQLDGLPQDDKDFRAPGALIEKEFQEPLRRALNNETVMPDKILHTEWGDVFVVYYPLTNDKREVIGALGFEFSADNEYKIFTDIITFSPFVILFACVVTVLLSKKLFNRVLNPHFQDFANTDSLTGLKNRNAFNVDVHNFIHTNNLKDAVLVLSDLNGLKLTNDRKGHAQGDSYIQLYTSVLKSYDSDSCVHYRIGGDEFATVFFNTNEKNILEFIAYVKKGLLDKGQELYPVCGVSAGYAFCEISTESAWEKTQFDADIMLYKDKQQFYAELKFCIL